MQQVFGNGIKTRLNGSLTDSATTATVNDGSVFPTIGSGEVIVAKFTRMTSGAYEIVHVTAISTNDLTIERGKDDTTALVFDNGDDVEMVVTSGILESLQKGFRPVTTISTATHTLVAGNAGAYLLCDDSNGCDITVPSQSSVAWDADAEVHGRASAGSTVFTAGDSNVTIDVPAGFEVEVSAGSAWTLKREAEDSWALIGNLVESA